MLQELQVAVTLIRVALISSAMFLAACATPLQLPANPADRDPAAGTIVFYRPMAIFGAGQRPDLLIDGVLVGRSIPGERFTAKASPGHRVVSSPSTMYGGVMTLDVDVRAGETIYVRTSMGGPSWAGLANVELIEEATATKEMRALNAAR